MDEATLDEAVWRILCASDRPLKAREIAALLSGHGAGDSAPVTRTEVNRCLYYRLRESVVINADYAWSAVGGETVKPEAPGQAAVATGPTLTRRQADIVARGCDERLLVTAPAGTGKTHVLLNRLVHLVEEEGLHGGEEILVLSFSRAAVREIRKRLAAVESRAEYVRVVTFDSFATWLLTLIDPLGTWVEGSYNDRIRECTRLLQADEEAREQIEELGHLLIDEVQDLVGVRAEMVLELLRHCTSGFTLFGDPSQAIYGFQLEGEDDGPTSQEFYAALREGYADELDELDLSENFRARTKEARRALEFGPMLSEHDPDYEAVYGLLREMIVEELDKPSLDDLVALLPQMAKRQSRRIALLCRTNGQALTVSGRLYAEEIPHRLQRRAVDRAVGPWLAAAFGLYRGYDVDRRRFLELIESCPVRPMLEPEEAWLSLRRSTRAEGTTVDLPQLATAVRAGLIADELNETPEASLVVSTIHRAKGLEFDDVFVVDFDSPSLDEDELPEETRLLYVALTRPRDRLAMFDCPKQWGLRRGDTRDARWEHRGVGANAWRHFGLEFLGDDVEKEFPPIGGPGGRPATVAELHDYLIGCVSAGDAVDLTLASAQPVIGDAVYTVRHGERVIGLTSKGFAKVLARSLGYYGRPGAHKYPAQINGLHIEMLDTVAGTPADAERFGIGPSALWLRPRLVGLGRFRWKQTEER